jgi:hypothetical protein
MVMRRQVLTSRLLPSVLRPAIPEPLASLLEPGDDLDGVAHSIGALEWAGLDVTNIEILALAVQGARNRVAEAQRMRESGEIDQRRQERSEAIQRQNERLAKQVAERSVVYYARLGNRVKIGYTTDLTKRMSVIQPEEILATERGGPKLESQRHAQFAELRVVGEWFRYEQPLIDHIAAFPETR